MSFIAKGSGVEGWSKASGQVRACWLQPSFTTNRCFVHQSSVSQVRWCIQPPPKGKFRGKGPLETAWSVSPPATPQVGTQARGHTTWPSFPCSPSVNTSSRGDFRKNDLPHLEMGGPLGAREDPWEPGMGPGRAAGCGPATDASASQTHRISSRAGQSAKPAARGLAAWLSISQETRLGKGKGWEGGF